MADTAVIFHDSRAFATCEGGEPMHISLPGLETVGWFNKMKSEGEIGVGSVTSFGNDGFPGKVTECSPRMHEHF